MATKLATSTIPNVAQPSAISGRKRSRISTIVSRIPAPPPTNTDGYENQGAMPPSAIKATHDSTDRGRQYTAHARLERPNDTSMSSAYGFTSVAWRIG